MTPPNDRRPHPAWIAHELELAWDENKRLRDQVVDLLLQIEVARERMASTDGKDWRWRRMNGAASLC